MTIAEALSILELSIPFSQGDLKHHYRQLCKQYHPDQIQEDTKCKKLNEAKEVLDYYLLSHLDNTFRKFLYLKQEKKRYEDFMERHLVLLEKVENRIAFHEKKQRFCRRILKVLLFSFGKHVKGSDSLLHAMMIALGYLVIIIVSTGMTILFPTNTLFYIIQFSLLFLLAFHLCIVISSGLGIQIHAATDLQRERNSLISCLDHAKRKVAAIEKELHSYTQYYDNN